MIEGYDINKPLIILASGPSARKIKSSNNYHIACVNLSSTLVDVTDFWIMNDANCLNEFSKEKLSTIKNVCLPEYPHSVLSGTYKPHLDYDYKKVTNHLPKHINVIPFSIFTMPNIDKSLPNFFVNSTGESAIQFFNYHGFKKIVMIGFDSTGGRSKNIPSKLVGASEKGIFSEHCESPERYLQSWNSIVSYASKNNIQIAKIEIPIDCEVDNKLIDSIKWDWDATREIKVYT